MSKVSPVTLQSLSPSLACELAIRSCAPIAFYMLLKASGYLPSSLDPERFVAELDRDKLSVDAGNPRPDWSRPALSRHLRAKYRAGIVSWQLTGFRPTDLDKMKASGYIESQREIDYFRRHIEGGSIQQIVGQGLPVIVTMKPGFGTPDNKTIHAVIILGWAKDKVTVIDPDARNPQREFEPKRVRAYISPDGAGSIVLPNTDHDK